MPPVNCLGRLGDRAYACTRDGLAALEVSGVVVPHREIKVAAEVSGLISKRHPACENGMFVSAGDVLLEIDREAYELELRTLEADVVQAERRIDETNLEDLVGLIVGEKAARLRHG